MIKLKGVSKVKAVWGFVLFILIWFFLQTTYEQKVPFTQVSNTQNVQGEISNSVEPTIEYYMVVRVIDGDTIIVSKNEEESKKEYKVRLIGVDTPETMDPRKNVQCFGKEASDYLTNLLTGKKVFMEKDETQGDVDKYGRLLRYVYLEDKTLVNKAIIENGYGFEYTYKIPYKFQSEFKAAQNYAIKNKLGLWADSACVLVQTPQTTPKYNCDCEKLCTQITSCDEAYYQLNECGCSKRDGDGDGVPCENLCR